MFEVLLLLSDRIGVFVFALSGAIVAVRKNMDLFGVIVLAFLPAVGGGTIRDLILGAPVFWLSDHMSLYLAIAGGLCVFFFYKWIDGLKPLRWADAFGMAIFAVAGAAKSQQLGVGLPVILIMGVVTASFGGLMRDVVANEDPLLLKQDIYATAALVGAALYVGIPVLGFSELMSFSIAVIGAFVVRACAIIWGWSLPRSPYSGT